MTPPRTRPRRAIAEMLHAAATSIFSWAGEIIQASSWLWKTAGWLLFVGLVLWAVDSGFDLLDESLDTTGWILHSHDTPVWIAGDWMVGEYRNCQMQTTTPTMVDVHYTMEELHDLPRLFCGNTSDGDGFREFALAAYNGNLFAAAAPSENTTNADLFHVLPVRYFGRLERPDRWMDRWRCQRENGSLTCWALN